MRKAVLSLLFFLVLFSLASQPNSTNIWYFGHHAGIKFTNGIPVALSNGQVNNSEGSSVVCDNFGNLLFYTDGVTVWNKNHVAMPNGSGLFGNTSSTQTTIVRKPGNCLQYYIFYHSGQIDLKAYYCIVDMTLNGGLGDIIVSTKNTLIYSQANEKITSVNHQNGTDVWVIFHAHNSNKFMAYLVTPAGLSPPVNTNIGPIHTNMIGYMKASHKGDKIATAITFTPDIRVELYDFNNATGVLSNPILFNNWNGAYGLEFSPNDSLLYATQYWNTNNLYQINLSNNTFQSVFSTNNGNYDLCALQLGPDGKIYMARSGQNYLSVINNPDVLGLGCNVVSNGFTLASGTTGDLGLPTFHQSALNFHANSFTYTSNGCNTVDFQCTPQTAYDSLSWNFDDPASLLNNTSNITNPSHSFSGVGSYDVTLIIYNECYTDTLHQLINISNSISVNLGNDTIVCNGGQFALSAGTGFASYTWNTGAHTSTINATNSGIYSLTVTDNAGCVGIDSINIQLFPQFSINLGNDSSFCSGNSLLLNAGNGYSSYFWNTGASSSSITAANNGVYSVTVTNSNGCSAIDSILLNVNPNPSINLGNDTSICIGNQVIFNAGNGFTSYLWNDGTVNSSTTASNTGIYSVTVTNGDGCSGADSVLLNVGTNIIFSIGNDTTICEGSQITIDAGSGYATYLWNTGLNTQTIAVTDSGQYIVSISDNAGCNGTDTLNLFIEPIPIVNIGNDTILCKGSSITLDAGNTGSAYLWSTSSVSQTITVNNSGLFWVSVTNNNCSSSDSILVRLAPTLNLGNELSLCNISELTLSANILADNYLWSNGNTNPSITITEPGVYWLTSQFENCIISDTVVVTGGETSLYIPNAFSPDNDGLNEVFIPIGTGIEAYRLMIFNRWGELLFETNDILQGWNGKFKNNICQIGIYSWVMEYETICSGDRYYRKYGFVMLLK